MQREFESPSVCSCTHTLCHMLSCSWHLQTVEKTLVLLCPLYSVSLRPSPSHLFTTANSKGATKATETRIKTSLSHSPKNLLTYWLTWHFPEKSECRFSIPWGKKGNWWMFFPQIVLFIMYYQWAGCQLQCEILGTRPYPHFPSGHTPSHCVWRSTFWGRGRAFVQSLIYN